MGVATNNAFLEVLQRSRLLSPKVYEEAATWAAQLNDPKSVARRLVRGGHLTAWQGGQLVAGRHYLNLGKYQLLDQIGSDNTGHVFLGKHTQMDRRVALKTLSRRFSRDAASVERFLSDTSQVASLDHRNIIHVYDVNQEDDRYYLVMEYIDGEDLESVVQKNSRLPFPVLADYIRQAADGLAYAHQRGLLHGDVRPGNLMVDKQGVVKILNLSLAGPSEGSDSVRRPAINYLSPEQAMGKKEVDQRADIFGLGATFYFLMTGFPPFPESEDADRLRKEQIRGFQDPRKDRPDAPAALVEICDKMLKGAREDRYQSAAEVRDALAAWLEKNGPAHVETPPLPTTRPKPAPARQQRPAKADRAVTGRDERIVITDDELPADHGSLPDIVIDTGPKRRRAARSTSERIGAASGANAVVAAAAVVSPAESTPMPGIPAGVRSQRGLLIGVIGGVVATVLLGGILALLFWPRSEKPGGAVAQGQAGQESADRTKQVEAKSNSAERTPDKSPRTPAVTNTASSPTNPVVGGDVGTAETTDEPPGDPANSVDPDSVDPDSGGKSIGPSETNTTAPPVSPPADSGGEKEPFVGAPQTPVGDGPGVAPDPPVGNGNGTKPESGKKPPHGGDPKPDTSGPFGQLAAAVDLPALAPSVKPDESAPPPTAAVSLGRVLLAGDADATAEILGVESAFKTKGRSSFEIRPATAGADKLRWEIVLVDKRPSADPPAKIAEVMIKDEELWFRWTPAAVENKDANYLRNCLLRLLSGTTDRQVALRKPVATEPISTNLDRGRLASQIDVDWLPDSSTLKLEVFGIEGGILQQVPEPAPFVSAGNKDDVWIKVGEGSDPPLGLKALATATTRVQVSFAAFYRLGAYEPQPFSVRAVTALARDEQINMRKLEALKHAVEKDKVKVKDKDKVKKELTAKIEERQAIIFQIGQIGEVYKLLKESGKIHFRVYHDNGFGTVDLVTTNPPADLAEQIAAAEKLAREDAEKKKKEEKKK